MLSNHDFPRLPDRVGKDNVRAAALLALTLPGPVFVYQGDEIGMADGPGREPPDDRAGRDRHRHPMRWDDDAPHGGFSARRAVAAGDRGRRAAPSRRSRATRTRCSRCTATSSPPAARWGRASSSSTEATSVLAFRRGGDHVVAVNIGTQASAAPPAGEIVRFTHAERHAAGSPAPATLEPGEGFLARA